GRRERAAPEPEAADETEADPTGAEMPLDDGDLRQVAARVGNRLSGPHRRLLDERLGDDLARDEPDHARATAAPRDAKDLGAERAHADGLPHPVRHLGARDL